MAQRPTCMEKITDCVGFLIKISSFLCFSKGRRHFMRAVSVNYQYVLKLLNKLDIVAIMNKSQNLKTLHIKQHGQEHIFCLQIQITEII